MSLSTKFEHDGVSSVYGLEVIPLNFHTHYRVPSVVPMESYILNNIVKVVNEDLFDEQLVDPAKKVRI